MTSPQSSSRFISAGTTEQPTQRDSAWLQAQADLDAKHLAKQTKLRPGEQEGGKSLYETLQANKAAKQEAHESALRLSNQFQSLNEDEVEFLDGVLAEEKRKEADVKRETAEEMERFRKQREEAERVAKLEGGEEEVTGEQESWGTGGGRKRKKEKVKIGGLVGVKLRRLEGMGEVGGRGRLGFMGEGKGGDGGEKVDQTEKKGAECVATGKGASPAAITKPRPDEKSTSPAASKSPPAASALGLGAYYSSDDDDD